MERSHGLITKRVELEACLFLAGGKEMAFEKNMPAIICSSLMLRMPSISMDLNVCKLCRCRQWLLLPCWWSLNVLSFCATMKGGRNSLPSTLVGLWNCTWCPPTSFPLFRTLPPGPSILQIKAHSFSGSLFCCELSNVHLHITENLALFPMEVVEQQMGGQAKGLTYLLREVILCIFLWNTWDERVFIDKLWNNKILY